LAQVLAQLYMNSKNLRHRKIERFTLAHFATKYFNNMVFLFIYMQKKRCFSNITTYLILAYKTKLITVVPIEVFLKYWFNTLPLVDQFISSSSSRYSYTYCERPNSKYLIISGHFLSIYDWLVAQTTKVIGAFKQLY
jgi:hypothetical protein